MLATENATRGNDFAFYFRYIFAFIYTAEMILKIIARGFVLHSYAYLRNPWNCLDFTVVIFGYTLSSVFLAGFQEIFGGLNFTCCVFISFLR